MAMGSVVLKPGVNVERTLSLNEAGVSQSQMLRFKDGLPQTYGGWVPYGTVVGSTVKDLHAWTDVNRLTHISAAATSNVIVYTSGSGQEIIPQTVTTNSTVTFTINNSCNIVTIVDPGSSGIPSVYNSVFFNTPVAIGSALLTGGYPILSVLSSISYNIAASVNSTYASTVGILPTFYTSAANAQVRVELPNNGYQSVTGLQYSFIAPTNVGGLTIQGSYQIKSIIDSTAFTIIDNQTATTTSSATMNSSVPQIVYYVTIGPAASGAGFGSGSFGSGGFGIGTTTAGSTGAAITATDWTQDNWGEVLLICPDGGAIYTWSPESGYSNSQVIPQAPFFNGGIFVSMPQQILVAWRSCQELTGTQDNLVVRWSDAADYTNWTTSNATAAGEFHIPTGSIIKGGLQAPGYGVIWTDVDVWIMQYIGGTEIFNFTRAGSGCGLVGSHAAGVLAGVIYWCSQSNFYMLGNGGVQVIPCSVWDFIFQSVNTAQLQKIRCCPNSAFNEIMWEFPSGTSTENDSYVKLNILEQVWDCGTMSRTAWMDVSVAGTPIGADAQGNLWQHEMGVTNTGVTAASMRTGWWAITDGNDLAFVDFIIPDFIWGTYASAPAASINITFYSVNYPGDTPITHGPYTVTQATEYITPRIRGRLLSMYIQSNGNYFWRLGRIRYRYAPSGRR